MISKMIRILILTALVATCLLVAAPVKAQEPKPFYVVPIFDGYVYHVPLGRPVIFQWGWFAYNKGLIHEWMNAETSTYTLTDADGKVIWSLSADMAEMYWADEPIRGDPIEWWNNSSPNGYAWLIIWEYPRMTLEAGTYTITVVDTLSHPVNDAWHIFRDVETGERAMPAPDLFPAGTVEYHVTIIIQ